MLLTPLANSRSIRGTANVMPGIPTHLPEYRVGVMPKGRTCATCPTVLSVWNPNPVCHPCALVRFDLGRIA